MTSSGFGWHPLAALAERLRTSRRLRSRPPARRAWLRLSRNLAKRRSRPSFFMASSKTWRLALVQTGWPVSGRAEAKLGVRAAGDFSEAA